MEVISVIQSREIKARGPTIPVTAPGQPGARDRELSESELASPGSSRSKREEIQQITQALKDYIRPTQTNLKIQVDSGTGAIAVKVVSEDGSVIREIPPEEILNLAAKIKKMMGALFDRKV